MGRPAAPEAVGIPVPEPQPGRPRAFDERLFVRFPGLYRGLAALLFRLPRHSRIRRALAARSARAAAEARMRGDTDSWMLRYAPGAEMHQIVLRPDGAEDEGFEIVYRGSELRYPLEDLLKSFDVIEWQMQTLADLDGNRLLLLERFVGRGRGSGVELEDEIGHVLQLSRGLIRREAFWTGPGAWAEAIKAAGLPPGWSPDP